MRLVLIGILSAIFLSGCATSPPVPKIELTQGDRIGVLVDSGNTLSHLHVGTTVFNNFSRSYDYKSNLRSDISQAVEKSVQKAGLTVVNLQTAGFNYSDISNLVQAAGDKWQISSGKESIALRLKKELNLKAILVVKEGRVLASLECYGGPCAERYMDSSGLFTRSFFGDTNYVAVAAYQWNVFVLDPPADFALDPTFRKIIRIPSIRLERFKDPADFKNLTQNELAPVQDAILQFVGNATSEAIKTLNVK
jgi:hypothetical protein